MKKIFKCTILVTIAVVLFSCQSGASKANEVLAAAIQTEKNTNNKPEPATDKLPIQNSAYSEPVKKVLPQDELIKKCKVKTVKETGGSGWQITTYDKNGRKVKEESNYSGEMRKTVYTYVIDKVRGLVIKQNVKHHFGTTVTEFEYNDDNKVIKKTYTGSDGKVSVTNVEYDAGLNTRTESASSGTDKEFYDNRGLRVRFESCDEKGKLLGAGEAKYDRDGLKTSESSSIMGMKCNDEFKYNKNGQLIQLHRTGLLDAYFLYEYDERGLTTLYNNIQGVKEDKTMYTYTFY